MAMQAALQGEPGKVVIRVGRKKPLELMHQN